MRSPSLRRPRRAAQFLALGLLFAVATGEGCSESTEAAARADAPAAEPAAASANTVQPAATTAAAPSDLVLGEYACDAGHWDVSARRMRFDYKGYFVLQPGGTYRWLDDGGTGQYRFNAASKTITWLSGPIADMQPQKTTYQRNETTTQIDLTLVDGIEWSCGHNL